MELKPLNPAVRPREVSKMYLIEELEKHCLRCLALNEFREIVDYGYRSSEVLEFCFSEA